MKLYSDIREAYAPEQDPYEENANLRELAQKIAAEQDYRCGKCDASIFQYGLYFDCWVDSAEKDELPDDMEVPADNNGFFVFNREDARVRCPDCMHNAHHALEVPFPDLRADCLSIRNKHDTIYDVEDHRPDDPNKWHTSDRDDSVISTDSDK